MTSKILKLSSDGFINGNHIRNMNSDAIPNLNANKITSGIMSSSLIPKVDSAKNADYAGSAGSVSGWSALRPFGWNHDVLARSDPRFKYQETNLSNKISIETIRKLNAYKYKFKKEKDFDKFDYGFMADEVENVIPDAVVTRQTFLDIENIQCNYTHVDNHLLLKNIHDDEFDTNCNFHMLYTKCDFSNVSILEVNETTKTCVLDTSHNLNYIGKRQTDPLREYIYAHKENIKVHIDDKEYTTKLVYDKNIELNQLKIDISNIPITQDMSNVEIYRPSENYDIDAPVVEKTINEETGLTNYILELSNEQLEEIKDKSYDTMIWYAVNVKDGRSLNYNQIFMHYHGAIQYLDKENMDLKNEVVTLKSELEQIKEHLGL